MIRRLLCKWGFHSTFLQSDSWGLAYVCRYCDAVTARSI